MVCFSTGKPLPYGCKSRKKCKGKYPHLWERALPAKRLTLPGQSPVPQSEGGWLLSC